MTELRTAATRPDHDRHGPDTEEDALAAAGERDIEGRDRDLAADVRDREAEQRDREAEARDDAAGDLAASEREQEGGELPRLPSVQAEAADNRAQAVNDRKVAADDRAMAAKDREDSGIDELTGVR